MNVFNEEFMQYGQESFMIQFLRSLTFKQIS
jgi:hypothetical protein